MKMKKLASLFLVLMMVVGMVGSVSAEETTGSITVNNPKAGETYTAYKIFDVTYNADKSSYAYSIAANSEWFETVNSYNGLTLTLLSDGQTNSVVPNDKYSAPEFASVLKAAVEGKTGIALTLSDGVASVSNLDLGYYFVTSITGTLCNLTTTKPDAIIYDKNDMPFDKVDDDESVEVGQVVNYIVTGKVPDTTGFKTYTYKVTDTMSDGLTFSKDVKVYVDGTQLSGNYTISYTDTGYELNIDVMNLQASVAKKIEIKYSAIVNENAVSQIENNHVVLEYSNDPTDERKTDKFEDKETVYTAKIVIDKFKAGSKETKLAGAQFVLLNSKSEFYKYDEENDKVTWVADVANATVVTTDEKGFGEFIGLEDGTYYLREIAAPDGYNLLKEDVTITVARNGATTADLSSLTVTEKVENQSGTVLPETGGLGTTLFYIAGTILVVGALVLMITKRRVTEK